MLAVVPGAVLGAQIGADFAEDDVEDTIDGGGVATVAVPERDQVRVEAYGKGDTAEIVV